MIRDLVASALDDLGLHYDVRGDTICLDYRGQPAAYHLCINEVNQPHLLWLRFTPNIWIDASASACLELLTALNHRTWMVKCVRDITDGELYFDVEVLLYAEITKETIAEVVMDSCGEVMRLLPLVLRVQWGGLSAAEALAGAAGNAVPPPSLVEREALEIVEQLETDNE
jgi:hypothetical protein